MSWWRRLVALVTRRDLNREIDEELQFHIDATIDANRARGLSPEDARRDALRRFGSRSGLRERTREVNILGPLERFWQDLRFGTRAFAKNPALTIIAVVSIALGTGANVAIFSVADALLLRPLPVARPDSVLSIGTRVRSGITFQDRASYQDYLDLKARLDGLDGLMLYDYETVSLRLRPADRPRVRMASFISDNYFGVLGLDLPLGRAFTAAESALGTAQPVVILSDAMWRADFDADPHVVGRPIRIGTLEGRIVGVAPASFTGLHPFVRESVFVPFGLLPKVLDLRPADTMTDRRVRRFTMKGRLRQDTSLAQLTAMLTTVSRDLERDFPDTNRDQLFVAETELAYKMEQRPLDAALVTLLSLLSVAVLCVACANVAGLLSSRAPARAREMALRLAVGASRARLVRQLLTETLGIALLGAVGGLVVARVTMLLLGQVQFPSDVIQPPPFELDERGLIFGLLVATATTILVGLGPAITTTRVDLVSDLKAGDRSGTGRSRLAGRSVLVSSQVALSLMLLTIAGFTVQVARRELTNGPGFRATQMVKVTIDPGQAHYSPAKAEQYFDELVERARAMPGVTAATITSAAPLYARMHFVTVVPDGGSADAQAQGPSWRGGPGTPAWAASVDHAYFDVYEIGLVAGRVFSKADDEKSAPVVIVNDTLARHYWPGQSAIGQRVEVIEGTHTRATVVGVVKTTKYLYLGEPPQDGIFFPYRQRERSQMTLVLATNGESAAMLDPVRELVQSMDPDVPTLDLHTIERFYQAHTRLPLVATRLIVGLGLVGLSLTIVGLYGLVSYGVSRRTREIGIRIAIGASYLRIIRMIVSEGMVAAWTGLAIGLVLSALTARSLPSLVPVNDPVSLSTFYLVVPLLAMVTVLAAFIPARRAANVSPTIALRVE